MTVVVLLDGCIRAINARRFWHMQILRHRAACAATARLCAIQGPLQSSPHSGPERNNIRLARNAVIRPPDEVSRNTLLQMWA